jgi:hypothetical protein
MAKNKTKSSVSENISSFVLPGMFVAAWVFALTGSAAPGAVADEASEVSYLKWILYFCMWVFLFSSLMHSLFAKKMAKSIGWVTNGFQYEIAAVSLGLAAGCYYAVHHSEQAWVAISLPIISFLFFAGLNHLKEIIKQKNYAPNNTLILIWDFGVPASLAALLLNIVKF